MTQRRRALDALRAKQHRSLGYLLIQAGRRFNELGVARVNHEAGAPVLREAHTRLLPSLMAEGGVRITTLARQVGVTKQAVQQSVAELAALGVVRVETDPDDARARRVSLTEAGLAAMHHGTGVLLSLEQGLARRVGRRRLASLRATLPAVLEALDAMALAQDR